MKSNPLALLHSERCGRYFLGILLAAVFIIAGVSKLSDLGGFAEDIARYRLLPTDWIPLVASSLPWLEILVGIGLFVKPWRFSASFLILVLMGMFTVAVASALMRGLDISCGCFGKAFGEYMGSGATVLFRDLILLAASFWLFLQNARIEMKIYPKRVLFPPFET